MMQTELTRCYLALRVADPAAVMHCLHQRQVRVLATQLERRAPAFRNLLEGLWDQGVEYRIRNAAMTWYCVEAPLSVSDYLGLDLCEHALDAEDFDGYLSRIRHLKGVAYWDATYGLAQQLSLKDQTRALMMTWHTSPGPVAPVNRKPETRVVDVTAGAAPGITNGDTLRTASVKKARQSKPAVKANATLPQAKRRRRVIKEEQLDLFAS